MITKFIKLIRFGGIIDALNQAYTLTQNVKPIIKYNMKDSDITDPYEIIQKFEPYGDIDKWSYSKLFYDTNDIDAVSIDQNSKFAYVIDNKHNLEILKNNIHYVKIIPNDINNLIKILYINDITFDVF